MPMLLVNFLNLLALDLDNLHEVMLAAILQLLCCDCWADGGCMGC